MENHIAVSINDDLGTLTNDVPQWSTEEVKLWLRQNGYKDVEITGQGLLALTRDQLQQSPFHMTNMHEVDHLQACIETLRKQQITSYMKKGVQNGYHNIPQQTLLSNGRIANGHTPTIRNMTNSNFHEFSKDSSPLLPDHNKEHPSSTHDIHTSCDSYPLEVMKTFISFLYMMFGFVLSVFMLQVVHERVPPITVDPPLPDVFFDIVPKRIEWAFSICEWSGMILTFFTAILCIFHKHRLRKGIRQSAEKGDGMGIQEKRIARSNSESGDEFV